MNLKRSKLSLLVNGHFIFINEQISLPSVLFLEKWLFREAKKCNGKSRICPDAAVPFLNTLRIWQSKRWLLSDKLQTNPLHLFICLFNRDNVQLLGSTRVSYKLIFLCSPWEICIPCPGTSSHQVPLLLKSIQNLSWKIIYLESRRAAHSFTIRIFWICLVFQRGFHSPFLLILQEANPEVNLLYAWVFWETQTM